MVMVYEIHGSWMHGECGASGSMVMTVIGEHKENTRTYQVPTWWLSRYEIHISWWSLWKSYFMVGYGEMWISQGSIMMVNTRIYMVNTHTYKLHNL
jgi:hypothetical protein